MSRKMKGWLAAGVLLVLVGCMVFVGAMAMMDWNFKKLSTEKYETNRYEITESFSSLSIDTKVADVKLLPSEDGSVSVVCYEREKMKHSVEVVDRRLTVSLVDTRKWYEHVSVGFDTPSVTVFIPSGEYSELYVKNSTGRVDIPSDFAFGSIELSLTTGNVSVGASVSGALRVKTSTGGVSLDGVSAGSIELSLTTGRASIEDVSCDGELSVSVTTGRTVLARVTCGGLTSGGSTGGISLDGVIVEGRMTVERSTGSVKLERCDAAEIFIETDTGDVRGSLLTGKQFVVETDTGDLSYPRESTGGRCEITTDTGDVVITVVK